MKKLVLLLMLAGLAGVLLTGCSAVPTSEAESVVMLKPVMETAAYDMEIREKLFVAQTNDVYINPDEYIGKSIKLEGMFFSSYYEPSDSLLCTVMRYGPGCCGTDGVVGVEVTFDQDTIQMPEDNDWVEIVGTLEWYEELGFEYLRLNLASMKVLETRGAETVLQ